MVISLEEKVNSLFSIDVGSEGKGLSVQSKLLSKRYNKQFHLLTAERDKSKAPRATSFLIPHDPCISAKHEKY